MTNRNGFPEFTIVLQDGSEHDINVTFADLARLDLLRASTAGSKVPELKSESPLAFVALSYCAAKRLEIIDSKTGFESYLNDVFADLLIDEDALNAEDQGE